MDLGSDVLWTAFGLMLVFEGVMPFVSPEGWRNKMMQILSLHNGQIRFFGLACVLAGVLILWWLG
jgi:uncharacterized protein YjeT (DUF2065 family)